MMLRRWQPFELCEALAATVELAVLDVREQGEFGCGHILLASNLPASHLELHAAALVPCRSTPVVLCDDGGGYAEHAATKLIEGGYRDVGILDGGVSGWAGAGYEIYRGINVPSKVFGELVERRFDTPRVDARALAAMREAGEDVIVLDSRPLDEFQRMCIPGGIDTPGAELVYRVHDIAPDPRTTVVVNCAGRTRSIIGCQSLINAGLSNPVMALENGTMGWHLAGLGLERGSLRRFPPVTPGGSRWGREAARRVAERFGVRTVDVSQLERWRAETSRCLYVFDVRQPEDYLSAHLQGARHAQGGQLVQTTDSYVAVRAARIVLVDDQMVRALMTASWLVQMGLPEVHALEWSPDIGPIVQGPEPRALLASRTEVLSLSAATLRGRLAESCVLDLSSSSSFSSAHIPGAIWIVRSRLPQCVSLLPAAAELVVTAEDEDLARLGAADLRGLTSEPVRYLEGGNGSWRATGFAMEEGLSGALMEVDDVFTRPYDRAIGQEAAMRAYLDWEIALIDQVERDATIRFPTF